MNLLPDESVPNEANNWNQVAMTTAGSGMSFALNELNKKYVDGKVTVLDVGASSADFLRQAAFARESLLKPDQPEHKE